MVLSTVVVAASCAPIRPQGESPLKPAHMPPDSVVVEVFFVRVPFGDETANVEFWHEVDEQHFPPDVRRRLSQNGFRAGMVAGQVPSMALSQLLELKDKLPLTGASDAISLEDMADDSAPMRGHLQLRAGRRGTIVTSEIYADLPVLISGADGVGGDWYQEAQGVLEIKAYPQRDGRVRLDIVPELQHGEVRQRFTGSRGAWRLEAGKDRLVLDELAVSATLTAGHMLVFSSLPELPGSLGHYFLTQQSDGALEQRLVVVRLAQTQHDELFVPTEVLPLDAALEESPGVDENRRE